MVRREGGDVAECRVRPRLPSNSPGARRRSPPTRQCPPDPQSQSFSRSYGSNLPTSLTYVLPSTRGCSPWRPDAVVGTTERDGMSVRGFSRAAASAPDRPKADGSAGRSAPSPNDSIPERRRPSTRRENPRRDPRRRLRARLRHRLAARLGEGILTFFPFGTLPRKGGIGRPSPAP